MMSGTLISKVSDAAGDPPTGREFLFLAGRVSKVESKIDNIKTWMVWVAVGVGAKLATDAFTFFSQL